MVDVLTISLTRWYLVLQRPRISSKCFWNVSLESKTIPKNCSDIQAAFLQGTTINTGCPKKCLEKNGSARKSDELTNNTLVDRINRNLNFDTSFVKIGRKLTELLFL